MSNLKLVKLLLALGASQVALAVENTPSNAGGRKRHGCDPWIWKIPWKKAGQLTPVFLSGESHGQKSLVGYVSQTAGYDLL